MRSPRLSALLAAVASLALMVASPATHAQSPSTCAFKPSVGQSGKDVIWVPTPDSLVDRMLRMAQVTPNDYLIDLGSGDGKIVITAARNFKVRGHGIEYNPDMVDLSRCLAREARVTDMVRFDRGDIFQSDFTQASVITMYLLPGLNLRLRPILFQKMRPGTRIVSHQFTMGDWQADETTNIEGKTVYYWLLPANAGGTWKITWRSERGEMGGEMNIDQIFQKIEGKVRFATLDASLREPRMRGDLITFELMDDRGVLRAFSGRIAGDRIEGTAVATDNSSIAFSAVRVGPAPPIRGATD
jgi:hypothetical protein